jgi:hypothetical protein
MKILLISSFLFSLILGLTHDFTLDNLSYSFRKVRDLYLKQNEDYDDDFLFDEFNSSNTQLVTFLKQCFQTNPVDLLKRLDSNLDFQLVYFFLSVIEWISSEHSYSTIFIWSEILDPKIDPKVFFKIAKILMRNIVTKMDWGVVGKDLLKVLLSIQRQFLCKLSSDKIFLRKVKDRLERYQLTLTLMIEMPFGFILLYLSTGH